MKVYHISEIFYSLQGEGLRAGTANVFVRFAHCNLKCSVDDPESGFDCDTEFESSGPYELEGLLEAMAVLWPTGTGRAACVLTGGEPGLQVDQELVDGLHLNAWYVAIETNGTKVLPKEEGRGRGIDWICVSPKSAWHTIRQQFFHELKIVRRVGQQLPDREVLKRFLDPSLIPPVFLVSPAHDADGLAWENLKWCQDLVLKNPEWRLSVQQHKQWRMR